MNSALRLHASRDTAVKNAGANATWTETYILGQASSSSVVMVKWYTTNQVSASVFRIAGVYVIHSAEHC